MRTVRIEKRHLSSVAALERACFSEPWSEGALALLLGDAATGAVCEEDGGGAVAYGGMLWAPEEGQITNIAVAESHRGRGLGSEILTYLIGEARKRRCTLLSLEVRESNLAAIRLYEKFGFSVAGRRKRFYKNPSEDALVMLLQLNYE